MRIALVLPLLLLLSFIHTAHAQESVLSDNVVPGDAASLDNPSSDAFQSPEPSKKAPWSWRDALADADPFIRDTTFKINFRTFYFAREDATDSPGNDNEKISWALGGSAQLKTGKLFDIFSIGAELFTSQKLYGPEDKDGALLLGTGQDGYTVLGVANPRFDYHGHVLSLYRQRHELPYLNSQENRMTPNTFESYSYGYVGSGENSPLQFGGGYVDAIKKRNSDEFVSMAEAAGVTNSNKGMPWAGFRLRPFDDMKIAAVNFAGLDFMNFFYADGEYTLKFGSGWSLKSSAQYSEQRSIGDDLLTGTDVTVGFWGIQEALSYNNFMIRTALTMNDKSRDLISPYGTYPGYNSSIVDDFNRAGEIAWKVGLSYDFAGVGINGLSAYTDYIQGNRAVDSNQGGLPDKQETDFNIDYRFQDSALKGLWLRFRAGFLHQEGIGTTNDFRVIANYDLPVL